MLDENLCTYSRNVGKMVTDESIRQGGDQEIWDIEDLTDLGRKKKGIAINCFIFLFFFFFYSVQITSIDINVYI